jgi:hypothetical protein
MNERMCSDSRLALGSSQYCSACRRGARVLPGGFDLACGLCGHYSIVFINFSSRAAGCRLRPTPYGSYRIRVIDQGAKKTC